MNRTLFEQLVKQVPRFKKASGGHPSYIIDSVAEEIDAIAEVGDYQISCGEPRKASGTRKSRELVATYIDVLECNLVEVLPIHDSFWVEGFKLSEHDQISRVGMTYGPVMGLDGRLRPGQACVRVFYSQGGRANALPAEMILRDGKIEKFAVSYSPLVAERSKQDIQSLLESCFENLVCLSAFTHLLTCNNIDIVEEKIWGPHVAEYERRYKHKPSPRRYLRISKPEFTCHNPRIKGEDTPSRKLPKHAVRGHFRVLKDNGYWKKPGRYWISPHWRGDEKLGIIDTPIVVSS